MTRVRTRFYKGSVGTEREREREVFSILTNSDARVTVDRLHQLFALMTHHPIGINLGRAFGVQRNHLELAEVCFTNAKVFGTDVIDVGDVVLVKVVFTGVAATVA